MLPFGVTIPAAVPQGSEIPEGLMNNPVYRIERIIVTNRCLVYEILILIFNIIML
jgi:hypothetical protein